MSTLASQVASQIKFTLLGWAIVMSLAVMVIVFGVVGAFSLLAQIITIMLEKPLEWIFGLIQTLLQRLNMLP